MAAVLAVGEHWALSVEDKKGIRRQSRLLICRTGVWSCQDGNFTKWDLLTPSQGKIGIVQLGQEIDEEVKKRKMDSFPLLLDNISTRNIQILTVLGLLFSWYCKASGDLWLDVNSELCSNTLLLFLNLLYRNRSHQKDPDVVTWLLSSIMAYKFPGATESITSIELPDRSGTPQSRTRRILSWR